MPGLLSASSTESSVASRRLPNSQIAGRERCLLSSLKQTPLPLSLPPTSSAELRMLMRSWHLLLCERRARRLAPQCLIFRQLRVQKIIANSSSRYLRPLQGWQTGWNSSAMP